MAGFSFAHLLSANPPRKSEDGGRKFSFSHLLSGLQFDELKPARIEPTATAPTPPAAVTPAPVKPTAAPTAHPKAKAEDEDDDKDGNTCPECGQPLPDDDDDDEGDEAKASASSLLALCTQHKLPMEFAAQLVGAKLSPAAAQKRIDDALAIRAHVKAARGLSSHVKADAERDYLMSGMAPETVRKALQAFVVEAQSPEIENRHYHRAGDNAAAGAGNVRSATWQKAIERTNARVPDPLARSARG